MNNIESGNNVRSDFFPNSKNTGDKAAQKAQKNPELLKSALRRNQAERIKELENTREDAKVDISNSIRDFSRMKKAVDAAPEKDNSEKVQRLKQQVQSGNYKVDHEKLADKLLEQEFRS